MRWLSRKQSCQDRRSGGGMFVTRRKMLFPWVNDTRESKAMLLKSSMKKEPEFSHNVYEIYAFVKYNKNKFLEKKDIQYRSPTFQEIENYSVKLLRKCRKSYFCTYHTHLTNGSKTSPVINERLKDNSLYVLTPWEFMAKVKGHGSTHYFPSLPDNNFYCAVSLICLINLYVTIGP